MGERFRDERAIYGVCLPSRVSSRHGIRVSFWLGDEKALLLLVLVLLFHVGG